ncbi:hypothetical protein FCV25MIE_15138 [Fagus crenata]
MPKRKTRYREIEKMKDNMKVVPVTAVLEVKGKVDSKSGATVTTENTERIRQLLRFFLEVAPVIPRNLGKGITIHINETGQRQVDPAFINGPTETQVAKGFGPRSTYEVGESSGSKHQQHGPKDEFRDLMGSERSRNISGSNLVDSGPSTLDYNPHGLPNFHLKESRALLTGRGAYQIRVDWHLVEVLIYTNRGMSLEVPIKCRLTFDLRPQRSLRLIAGETIFLQMVRIVRGSKKSAPP